MYTNINRGNRFTRINSFATKARGLHDYVVKQGGANHPSARTSFKLGDVYVVSWKCNIHKDGNCAILDDRCDGSWETCRNRYDLITREYPLFAKLMRGQCHKRQQIG